MPTALVVLARYKESIQRSFKTFIRQAPAIPPNVRVPDNAEEAFTLGIKLGRQEGYSQGLTAGVQLGLDVSMETAAEMSRQNPPGVFTPA